MTSAPETIGWATHHDEPLLFPDCKEAAAYCDEDEFPIELIAKADHDAAVGGLRLLLRQARNHIADVSPGAAILRSLDEVILKE